MACLFFIGNIFKDLQTPEGVIAIIIYPGKFTDLGIYRIPAQDHGNLIPEPRLDQEI